MPLWTVTIWDKRFNTVSREKQAQVKSYPYLLAADLFALEENSGNVFLLSTGEQTGWTTEEMAGNNLCEGEVVTIPWGKSRPVKEVIKYYKGKFVTADNRIATSNNVDILSNKYLYYFMQSQGEVIDTFYRGSGIKHPNMGQVLDMLITLPSIEEQERIVNILDKYDRLCNDIKEGLPAEIEKRQQQYEYYRDKLLTFKGNDSVRNN
ncbi:MAG: restriction endonuclease subunit S [Christensenellaceae bacterium]